MWKLRLRAFVHIAFTMGSPFWNYIVSPLKQQSSKKKRINGPPIKRVHLSEMVRANNRSNGSSLTDQT